MYLGEKPGLISVASVQVTPHSAASPQNLAPLASPDGANCSSLRPSWWPLPNFSSVAARVFPSWGTTLSVPVEFHKVFVGPFLPAI